MSQVEVPAWQGPAPKPRDASLAAQRLIDLANLVPVGAWVSYGDLADAYVVGHAENMVARGVASALSLLPAYTFVEERTMADPQPRVNEWHVPWHRIRLTDGRIVSRKYGVVASDDFANRMFVNEGGTLRHGSATADCRFNLVEAARSASPSVGVDVGAGRTATPRPDLTDRQRARLAERSEVRRYRLGG